MRWPRLYRGRHRPTKTEPACGECGHREVDHYLNDGCYGSGIRADYATACQCLAPFPGHVGRHAGPLVETWETSRTGAREQRGWWRG